MQASACTRRSLRMLRACHGQVLVRFGRRRLGDTDTAIRTMKIGSPSQKQSQNLASIQVRPNLYLDTAQPWQQDETIHSHPVILPHAASPLSLSHELNNAPLSSRYSLHPSGSGLRTPPSALDHNAASLGSSRGNFPHWGCSRLFSTPAKKAVHSTYFS